MNDRRRSKNTNKNERNESSLAFIFGMKWARPISSSIELGGWHMAPAGCRNFGFRVGIIYKTNNLFECESVRTMLNPSINGAR